MCGIFSEIPGLHAQLGDFTLCILCKSSRVKYAPEYIQLTVVACLTSFELSPACCQIRIGVVVDKELRSTYSEDDLGSASVLNFWSQCSVIAVRQWDRHLSGLHGCCRYCSGSGSPYTSAVFLTTADHPVNLSSNNARLCRIEALTFWSPWSHIPSWPRRPNISRSRWAVAGRMPMVRYSALPKTNSIQ